MYLSEHLWLPSDVMDVETNAELNATVNNTQMPKVEYRKISIEDYSEYLIKSVFFNVQYKPMTDRAQ